MKKSKSVLLKHPSFSHAFVLVTLLFSIAVAGFMSGASKGRRSSENMLVDLDALINRVTQLNKQKQHQKAIDLLLKTVREQKEDSILRMLLVQTFDLFLEEEIRAGQKALQKNPHATSHYGRVAGALELLGDNFHAMEILLNGIYYDQKSTDLWMKIARLELSASRENEALALFKEVIRLDKKNGDAYNNAAYLLLRAKDGDARDLMEADSFAKMAHKLDPKNTEYLDTLAEISYKKGDAKTAKTFMEKAIKLAPENNAYKSQLIKYTASAKN